MLIRWSLNITCLIVVLISDKAMQDKPWPLLYTSIRPSFFPSLLSRKDPSAPARYSLKLCRLVVLGTTKCHCLPGPGLWQGCLLNTHVPYPASSFLMPHNFWTNTCGKRRQINWAQTVAPYLRLAILRDSATITCIWQKLKGK